MLPAQCFRNPFLDHIAHVLATYDICVKLPSAATTLLTHHGRTRIMRLLIDTRSLQFRVASAAKPRMDYKDKDRQAKDRDGRPIWTVSLDAIDAERKTKEPIWVEVAGDEPKLTFDGYAVVRNLVFAPWVGRDGKIKRSFRADAIDPAPPGKPVQAA